MAELLPAIQDPAAQVDWLNANGRRFQAAAEGFRLLEASPEQLFEIGYPPRPDESEYPEIFAIWKDVFSRQLTYEAAHFSLPEATHGRTRGSAISFTRHEGSRNWSGAYITPRAGLMMTDVIAFWTVPTVSAPPSGPAGGTYGSSTWIGLDGQRGYFHSTLPQVGTAQFLNLPSTPGSKTQAWVQWWPFCPVYLGMLVVPGDLMFAWLRVHSLTEVHFILVNVSRLTVTPFTLCAPDITMPPNVPSPVQARVSGATAEWIMERPAICPNPNPLPLPRYLPVEFFGCYALAAHAPGPPEAAYRLVSPRLIRMYEPRRNPNRTVTVSVAERPDPLPPGLTYTIARTTFRP